jgi:hypothetical protein
LSPGDEREVKNNFPALIVFLVFTFLAALSPASSVAQPAESAECKGIIARLMQETNAKFDHVSGLGNEIFFQHPLVGNLSLACITHRLTGVSMNWDDGSNPPKDWFALAAKAGRAVTGVDRDWLEAAIRKCHRVALKDPSEESDVEIPHARIECQAFTHDGGGVVMSIWITDRGPPKAPEEPETEEPAPNPQP